MDMMAKFVLTAYIVNWLAGQSGLQALAQFTIGEKNLSRNVSYMVLCRKNGLKK